MEYILDTANIAEITKGIEIFPIVGVTTNPTIIAKENKPLFDILENILEIIGSDRQLHVQVLGKTMEEMVAEAYYLKEKVGNQLYVKIPVFPEGLKAIKKLANEGFKITATGIITANQAFLAAMCGATYVAPYVNRIDNISGNGTEVVKDIVTMFEKHGLNSKVLAASFKNSLQLHEVILNGGQAATLPLDILMASQSHPLTDWSLEQFTKDWGSIYGIGKLVTDQ